MTTLFIWQRYKYFIFLLYFTNIYIYKSRRRKANILLTNDYIIFLFTFGLRVLMHKRHAYSFLFIGMEYFKHQIHVSSFGQIYKHILEKIVFYENRNMRNIYNYNYNFLINLLISHLFLRFSYLYAAFYFIFNFT